MVNRIVNRRDEIFNMGLWQYCKLQRCLAFNKEEYFFLLKLKFKIPSYPRFCCRHQCHAINEASIDKMLPFLMCTPFSTMDFMAIC